MVPDQTPRSAASGLVLHCLSLSHRKNARLIWVKVSYGQLHSPSMCRKDGEINHALDRARVHSQLMKKNNKLLLITNYFNSFKPNGIAHPCWRIHLEYKGF